MRNQAFLGYFFRIPYFAVYKPRLLLVFSPDFGCGAASIKVRLLFKKKIRLLLFIIFASQQRKNAPVTHNGSMAFTTPLSRGSNLAQFFTKGLWTLYYYFWWSSYLVHCDQGAAYNRVWLLLHFYLYKIPKSAVAASIRRLACTRQNTVSDSCQRWSDSYKRGW